MKTSDQYRVLRNAGFNERTIDQMSAEQREYEAEAYVEAQREAQVIRTHPHTVDPINF